MDKERLLKLQSDLRDLISGCRKRAEDAYPGSYGAGWDLGSAQAYENVLITLECIDITNTTEGN